MAKKCKTCVFFEPATPQDNAGPCKRLPPTQDGNGMATVDYQPTVRPDDWCGEHKQKRVKKVKKKTAK